MYSKTMKWFPSNKISDFLNVIKKRPQRTPAALPTARTPYVSDMPPAPVIVRQSEQHPSEAYMDLKRRFRDTGRLLAAGETLGRDFLTAMPEGAWRSRLSQISYVYRRVHEDLRETEVSRQLERAHSHLANNADDWDDWDRANLREMEKISLRMRHIDPDMTEHAARLAYEGRRQHRDVLGTGDWMQGRDFLTKTVDMKRQIAESICRATGQNDPYQVLINEYMPDQSLADIETWFETMRKTLTPLLPKIMEKQKEEPDPLSLIDFYPAKAQMWLNTALLQSIGFDFQRGGLYETGHNPVEGGTPEDTRLVIRTVDTTNFIDSMKSALHEGGHGIYVQGLPRRTWRYQPVGQDMGADVHESQALLIEMIMGRTSEFFKFLSPRVEGLFHGLRNPVLSARNLHIHRTRVKPTMLRRSADEVTYFFHVLLRFRLERDLINGRLKLADLPEAWANGMEELLGIRPATATEGCLQDVHWFVGKFGYFPAYTIGHMMAAQQFATIKKEHPDVQSSIAQGDFSSVTNWLQKNIHSQGRLLNTHDLMKRATGKDISPDYLLKHLEDRYLKAA